MRDYVTMRAVLEAAANAGRELCYSDFHADGRDDKLREELTRLTDDGLLDADVAFDVGFGEVGKCNVKGLTAEGRAFPKLVENDMVWELILATLNKAGIDVSYPLLKEVCEEIVKRYVTSFIPEMPTRR